MDWETKQINYTASPQSDSVIILEETSMKSKLKRENTLMAYVVGIKLPFFELKTYSECMETEIKFKTGETMKWYFKKLPILLSGKFTCTRMVFEFLILIIQTQKSTNFSKFT